MHDNLYFRMPYFQEIDRFKVPDWVAKTVWYQIFPSAFIMAIPRMIRKVRLRGAVKNRPERIFRR